MDAAGGLGVDVERLRGPAKLPFLVCPRVLASTKHLHLHPRLYPLPLLFPLPPPLTLSPTSLRPRHHHHHHDGHNYTEESWLPDSAAVPQECTGQCKEDWYHQGPAPAACVPRLPTRWVRGRRRRLRRLPGPHRRWGSAASAHTAASIGRWRHGDGGGGDGSPVYSNVRVRARPQGSSRNSAVSWAGELALVVSVLLLLLLLLLVVVAVAVTQPGGAVGSVDAAACPPQGLLSGSVKTSVLNVVTCGGLCRPRRALQAAAGCEQSVDFYCVPPPCLILACLGGCVVTRGRACGGTGAQKKSSGEECLERSLQEVGEGALKS